MAGHTQRSQVRMSLIVKVVCDCARIFFLIKKKHKYLEVNTLNDVI